LVHSRPEVLEAMGFERVYVCDRHCTPGDLAVDAARAALSDAGVQSREIDVLVWASARPESHVTAGMTATTSRRDEVLQGFTYTSAWLQDSLDLHNAEVMAVSQQGCATMFSALRLARAILLTEPHVQHVLCVGVDALPAGACREILHTVISDGACGVVVSRGGTTDRWVAYRQLSRGYYWDPCARGPEIVASYFPTAKVLIEQLVADAGFGPQDVDAVVATGVAPASWDVLVGLVGIPADRIFRDRPSFGHTITADSFLYLEELRKRPDIPRGSRLLLFTFGFGSSFCGLLLEH
jgi:3-oxoacyl-[acyl-carrier-protein] synthase III